jgi:hypothetical protein
MASQAVGVAVVSAIRDMFFSLMRKAVDPSLFDESYGANFIEEDAERIGAWAVRDTFRIICHLTHQWKTKNTQRCRRRQETDVRLAAIVKLLLNPPTATPATILPDLTPASTSNSTRNTPAPTPSIPPTTPLHLGLTPAQRARVECNRLGAVQKLGENARTSANSYNNFVNRGGWHRTLPDFGEVAQPVLRIIVGHLTVRNMRVSGLKMVKISIDAVMECENIKEKFDTLLRVLCVANGVTFRDGDFDTIRARVLKKMCNARIGEFVAAHEGRKGVNMSLRAGLKGKKA